MSDNYVQLNVQNVHSARVTIRNHLRGENSFSVTEIVALNESGDRIASVQFFHDPDPSPISDAFDHIEAQVIP